MEVTFRAKCVTPYYEGIEKKTKTLDIRLGSDWSRLKAYDIVEFYNPKNGCQVFCKVWYVMPFKNLAAMIGESRVNLTAAGFESWGHLVDTLLRMYESQDEDHWPAHELPAFVIWLERPPWWPWKDDEEASA